MTAFTEANLAQVREALQIAQIADPARWRLLNEIVNYRHPAPGVRLTYFIPFERNKNQVRLTCNFGGLGGDPGEPGWLAVQPWIDMHQGAPWVAGGCIKHFAGSLNFKRIVDFSINPTTLLRGLGML